MSEQQEQQQQLHKSFPIAFELQLPKFRRRPQIHWTHNKKGTRITVATRFRNSNEMKAINKKRKAEGLPELPLDWTVLKQISLPQPPPNVVPKKAKRHTKRGTDATASITKRPVRATTSKLVSVAWT